MWNIVFLDEAFEFHWRSLADKHNNLPKSTITLVKRDKYLEPHDYRIYDVNIDLRHQYGISIAASETFLRTKRPSGEERGETDVFAGYSGTLSYDHLNIAIPFLV